ncbi:MAG TPA: aldehyde ferredoxin oxidoreductase family protein [Planctomycetota bacterium]|nr:aldehyde ferredoxin oxidoreductase family protein [Planctomycetota bacterium]
MIPGYHGAYLRVDLSTGESRPVAIPRDVLARYIGGVGLGTWICFNEGGPAHDPLAPEAPLILCLSPLVGTPLTTSAKFAVVARSPLTGYLCDAISSSHFAIAAKRAGYDAYAIVGRAKELSRLVVDDGRATVREEGGLRGRPAAECGLDGYRTAAIGPAGERLVRYAMISNDGRHAGRGGLGAVMGAKNLKAFSVRGTKRVEVADPKGVVAEARRLSELSFGPATAKYRELGTIANVLAFNRLNTLPARNFRDSSFEGAPEISAEALHAMDRVGRESCAACTIGCEHIFRAPGGEGVRLEYESVFALGPLLGIPDRAAMIEAARLCDLFGLDTISLGGTLACWMDAGRMRFGDAAAVLDTIGRIARREGDGDLLAEGSRHVAERLSRPDLAMHVKGLEIPGYDPRALPAMALGFAVGTRGADHNRSSAYELDFSTEAFDVRRVVEHENRAAAMDSLILCKFLRGVFADFAREGATLLRLVTGLDVDLLASGALICDLRKSFNVACGWRREEDTLPERLLTGKLSRGKLDAMIADYYRARGWSAEGLPVAAAPSP